MKHLHLPALAAFMALACAKVATAVPPPNDTCAGATPVFDGDNTVSNADATFDTASSCGTEAWIEDTLPPYNADVWYTYTAPATGLRNFEITDDPFGGYGYAISVYDGCGGTLLACNFSAILNTGFSKIYHLPVVQGAVYKIHIAGVFGAEGPGVLNIAAPPTPSVPMDDCATAIQIAGQPLIVPFNTAGLTTFDKQAFDCPDVYKDGWYAWTPSVSGIAVIHACNQFGNRANLSLYDTCGGVPIFCTRNTSAADPTEQCTPKICYDVIAGHTYYVSFSVTQPAHQSDGDISFDVRTVPGIVIPPNAITEPGACNDPTTADLNGGCRLSPTSFTQYNLCETYSGTASGRLSPLTHVTTYGGFFYLPILTVDADWYKLTLTTAQTVTITGQSEFPPLARIYRGTCSELEEVSTTTVGLTNCTAVYDLASNPIPLEPGTYYFKINPIEREGVALPSCGHKDRYWFRIASASCSSNQTCCRGTTCLTVAAGACTGTVAGSASVAVPSCGPSDQYARCCYADYDHSGAISIDDIFIYLNAWFSASPYTKIGGDGVAAPAIDDIFIFLNIWFRGCT